MDGNILVSNMKRLRDVRNVKEISQLTNAVFPGTHCPLMGAMMAVRGISDSIMLVIGTDECTYYTKNTTISNNAFGGLDGRCLSVVLDHHDVTFGCKEKLETAFKEVMDEYNPKAVFIVTTCLIEVIGDDIDSIADNLKEKYNIHIMTVHTEHFKTENHLPGVRDTITACIEMMKPVLKDSSVNVIGQRLGDFKTTELFRILTESGIEIGMMLPSGCTVEEIETGASACVNIVVNPIGLPLAKKMESEFGTSYVFFDKFVYPENIYNAYKNLYKYLEVPVPEIIETLYNEAKNTVASAACILDGITYIYGNTPLQVFEYNAFMTELGMIPLLIQTAELPESDDVHDLQCILKHSDPYVTKTANIAPLQYVYDVLKPNLYLGHEFAIRLREKGIELVRIDEVSGYLGFEVTVAVVKELIRASNEAIKLIKEKTAV